MPNPAVQMHGAEPADQAPHPERGILSFIPSEYLGTGLLPPAREGEQAVREVIVPAVPGWGDVCVTWRLASYKHGRGRFWHWVLVRGDRV